MDKESVKNKKIGIYYDVSSAWIGGKYYLDSILNVLKENDGNEIVYLKRSFLSKVVGKIFGKTSSFYGSFFKAKSKKLKLDVVFPAMENCYHGKKEIYWVPDFQENYFPEFFSMNDIYSRLVRYAYIAYSNSILVLSSESAKADFKRLFPKHTCEVKVLSFVSSLVNKDLSYDGDVLQKFDINEPYFICSNQFWKHKNHEVVIKAVEDLKNQGKKVLVLFTGKEEDFRNPDYPASLKKMVEEKGLSDQIKFLGFISRADQIELMKKAIAIVQPSLFEGWNTTIEDAKVLNKCVIASALPVHKEQLLDKGVYFDVDDYKTLATAMDTLKNEAVRNIDYNYQAAVITYKEIIQSLFN